MELATLLPEEDRARVKIEEFVRNVKIGDSDIVKLNLGGNVFYTLKSTLTKKQKNEVIHDWLNGTHLLMELFDAAEKNGTQIQFTERDPT